VVEVRLPPLVERLEDVPLLARRFLGDFARKNRKPVVGFTEGAERALTEYGWPGNVRELENVLERAVILCRGTHVGLAELPLGQPAARRPRPELGGLGEFTLEELERAMVQRALHEHGGNISRAATALGLSRAALYRRLEKFGLG